MKGWIVSGVALAALVIGVTGFEMFRNPERDAIDAAVRRSAPGKFIRLTDGETHYDVAGPDSGRAIVLVHGFSVPYYIWDSTAHALAAAGHRVIRYDEYGRGWSDRPTIVYTRSSTSASCVTCSTRCMCSEWTSPACRWAVGSRRPSSADIRSGFAR